MAEAKVTKAKAEVMDWSKLTPEEQSASCNVPVTKAKAEVMDWSELTPEEQSAICNANRKAEEPKTKRFTIPRALDKSEGDFVCAVNGRRFTIKRGIEVELPFEVYMTVLDSLKASDEAADFIEMMSQA